MTGSGGPSAQTADVAPEALLRKLVLLDREFEKLISDEEGGKLSGDQLRSGINDLIFKKAVIENTYFERPATADLDKIKVYGIGLGGALALLKAADDLLFKAREAHHSEAVVILLKGAKELKQKLEAELHKAAAVVLSTTDTWMHNAAVGKSNVCIDVRTMPAQASALLTLDGPSGYRSTSGPARTPLIGGRRQFISPITTAGSYTDKITVYTPAAHRPPPRPRRSRSLRRPRTVR